MKIWPKIDLIMLNTFTLCQNLAIPNCFADICEQLLSDPYVLFLVTVAMFFNGSKIPTSVLCRLPQGTFIPIFVPIDQMVSEKKSFEKLFTMRTMTDAKWWQWLTWPSARWANKNLYNCYFLCKYKCILF